MSYFNGQRIDDDFQQQEPVKQERTFSLQDMIECWNESGKYHSVDGFWKDSPDLNRWMKEKFNID